MNVLGIETSCDETAAAVVADGRRLLSNVVASQVDIHAAFGGVVPEVASRQHILWIVPVVEQALREAGVELSDVDGIAVTRGPGLAGSLLVGLNAAKALAYAAGRPFVGVNHLEGHIYANWLLGTEPAFPLICLIVSGGHTDLILMTDHGRYRRLGHTRDDAAGEAFDKVARILRLGYPGGPALECAARTGTASRRRLPRAWLPDSFDFSFSGLKTAVLRLVEAEGSCSLEDAADIAAGFQESVVDVLVEKTRRAAEEYQALTVLIAGGVASNTLLRQRMTERVAVPVIVPPLALCTDNAAMIAAAGYFALVSGQRSSLDLEVTPNLPLIDPAAT
jgi:N6-L-threonylcarbamoyladenine synthase